MPAKMPDTINIIDDLPSHYSPVPNLTSRKDQISSKTTGKLLHERIHSDDKHCFRVGLAATDWQKDLAHALVIQQYQQAGLIGPARAQSQSIEAVNTLVGLALPPSNTPDTTVLGTLSLRLDNSEGLLADEVYRLQLDKLRNKDAQLAEFGRLAMSTQAPFVVVLGRLVRTLAHVACHSHNVTDAVVICHPRHARFYSRALGFVSLGELTFCKSVGAPAVLLHLSRERLVALTANMQTTARIYNLRSSVAVPQRRTMPQTEEDFQPTMTNWSL